MHNQGEELLLEISLRLSKAIDLDFVIEQFWLRQVQGRFIINPLCI